MSDDDVAIGRNNADAFLRLMALLHGGRATHFTENEQLVEHLASEAFGNSPNQRILEAFRAVPRGDFIPPEQEESAYLDEPLPLSRWGFNVSAPHMYAKCLEALDVQPGQDILDIGSGCGHFTALCSFLAGPEGAVLGIDVRDDVVDFGRGNVARAMERHPSLSLHCQFENRNCFIPDFEDRRFDRVHCGACCPVKMLPRLVELLKPGGVLVTPCGSDLLKVTKAPEGDEWTQEVICNVRYGELVLPSATEVHVAKFMNEKKRNTTIRVAKSTFATDSAVLSGLAEEMKKSVEGGFSKTPTTDISLRLGEKTFHVHRSVMELRSDHFAALFHSGMMDANSDSIVIVPGCEPDSMVEFLRYLYTDEASINGENVDELLELSNFYQVDRLRGLCEKVLQDQTSVEEVCQILELADLHSAVQLKNSCITYILDHLGEVRETPGFAALPRPLLVDIIASASRLIGLQKMA